MDMYIQTHGAVALVDDSQDFLDAMRRILELNYRTYAFANTRDGLDALFKANEVLRQEELRLVDILTDEAYEYGLREAMKWLRDDSRSAQVETVFCDYQMPGMNGVELLDSIKESRLRRVLLTGQAGKSEAVDAFNRHAIDAYVEKGAELTGQVTSQAALGALRRGRLAWRRLDPVIAAALDLPHVRQKLGDMFRSLGVEEYLLFPSPAGYLCRSRHGLAWVQLETVQHMRGVNEMLRDEGWSPVDLTTVSRQQATAAVEVMGVLKQPLGPGLPLEPVQVISTEPWLGMAVFALPASYFDSGVLDTSYGDLI